VKTSGRASSDTVTREQQAFREYGAEAVEEEVDVADYRTEESRSRHAHLRISTRNRDVGGERELEAAAERVPLDLGHGCLGVPDVVVVEGEALAIDGELSPLAGTPVVPLRFVPAVGLAHIGARTEDGARTAQQQDLDFVVARDVVHRCADGPTHLRVVAVLSFGMVQGEPGDVGLAILVEEDAGITHGASPFSAGARHPIALKKILYLIFSYGATEARRP
jgi:hypothetical protein